MSLIAKLINKNDNLEDCYKLSNLYIGYIFFNSRVEMLDDDTCRIHGIMNGPIICHKPTLSSIYTRVSNGTEYLKENARNNSQEIGDSYFKIHKPLLDFVHTYMTGFEKATKNHYLDKADITNLERYLQENIVFKKQEVNINEL